MTGEETSAEARKRFNANKRRRKKNCEMYSLRADLNLKLLVSSSVLLRSRDIIVCWWHAQSMQVNLVGSLSSRMKGLSGSQQVRNKCTTFTCIQLNFNKSIQKCHHDVVA